MSLNRSILCVVDDPDDREIVFAAFQRIDPFVPVIHATNGVEAIEQVVTELNRLLKK